MSVASDASTENSGRPAPRQARALQTRQRLIDAGRSAFSRLGHDGVNLARDILEPARVSVGSFYHQFDDKTDLLLVILSDSAELRRSAILGLGSTSDEQMGLEEGLRLGFEQFFESLDTEEHGWQLQLSARSSTTERIREVTRVGRMRWIDEYAEALHRWSDADIDRCTTASTTLVAFAMGLANVHLDTPQPARRRQRQGLIEGAVSFASVGVVGLLGERTAITA